MEVLLRKEEPALNLELAIANKRPNGVGPLLAMAIVSLFGFLIVRLVFVFWGGQPSTLVPRPI
jgi:hypothetical protein